MSGLSGTVARRGVALCVVIGLLGMSALAQQAASPAPSSPAPQGERSKSDPAPAAQGASDPLSPEKKQPVSAEASPKDSGVSPDQSPTAALLEKACEGGEASACRKLGLVYGTGQGVDKDMHRAAVLLEKACEGGDASGCTYLA